MASSEGTKGHKVNVFFFFQFNNYFPLRQSKKEFGPRNFENWYTWAVKPKRSPTWPTTTPSKLCHKNLQILWDITGILITFNNSSTYTNLDPSMTKRLTGNYPKINNREKLPLNCLHERCKILSNQSSIVS